jgi:hypothetical protein
MQLGTDIWLGDLISDLIANEDDFSIHHIEQNKELWKLIELMIAHKNHDDYIIHSSDPDNLGEEQENQIAEIKRRKNIISNIINTNDPDFTTLNEFWSKEQIAGFIRRWNNYQILKQQFGENAKWAFLSHFYPNFMKKYNPYYIP